MNQTSNNSRIFRSLPALDLENHQPRSVPNLTIIKKKPMRQDNEALTYIVSAFYAKFLTILGIAFPITDAIAASDYYFDGFYMYLYSGSIIFLLYMYYVVQSRARSLQDNSIRNSGLSAESNESLNGVSKRNQYIRYGSFYFRMGVTAFGIGSVIYSGLEFGQYFELSAEKDCDNLIKAVKPLLRITFALLQMLFIFSYSNFLDVQRSKIIARFGLMHMIATNLCEWLSVLVQETQHDIYASAVRRLAKAAAKKKNVSEVDWQFLNSSAFKITQQYYTHKINCLKSNITDPILTKFENFLVPCTVEYSVLCAVILALMWKNNCGHHCLEKKIESPGAINVNQKKLLAPDGKTHRDSSAVIKEKQSGCNVIYSRRPSQFSVDCARSHKGLFSGILILAVTIISLIMFFELLPNSDYTDNAILQVNAWEACLFWTGTVAVIFCLAALRGVGLRKMKRDLELEHLLLLVTQCGVFMYFLFQIIGGLLMGPNKGRSGIMRIITPFSALVQSSCQTVLVLDAWRRKCNTIEQIRRKPGRQLITFLLVINISLWVVNRLKNNGSVYHPYQMDFYGVLAWNIITHVSMPLVVAYRFQSTVCFYEIWKHVYKMRPINLE